MNLNKSREALITKGIEQAWHRRFSYNIHSGVRVKVPQRILSLSESKNQSSANQINRMQSMLKRLWIESETSAAVLYISRCS